MDRLASITAFVRVAESDGFTAAARRLNVSTATVSENVQALENTLGVRLLNRTTRRVGLTEIGREYYERCVQILHDLKEADEAAGALQLTPRGQLWVYCRQESGSLSRRTSPAFWLGTRKRRSICARSASPLLCGSQSVDELPQTLSIHWAHY